MCSAASHYRRTRFTIHPVTSARRVRVRAPPPPPSTRAPGLVIWKFVSCRVSRGASRTHNPPACTLIDVHAGARRGARTERVCRGALSCEMILLSCGLGGIYFPITLLWLACLTASVDLCAGVGACTRVWFSLNNKVTVSVPFLGGFHFTSVALKCYEISLDLIGYERSVDS